MQAARPFKQEELDKIQAGLSYRFRKYEEDVRDNIIKHFIQQAQEIRLLSSAQIESQRLDNFLSWYNPFRSRMLTHVLKNNNPAKLLFKFLYPSSRTFTEKMLLRLWRVPNDSTLPDAAALASKLSDRRQTIIILLQSLDNEGSRSSDFNTSQKFSSRAPNAAKRFLEIWRNYSDALDNKEPARKIRIYLQAGTTFISHRELKDLADGILQQILASDDTILQQEPAQQVRKFIMNAKLEDNIPHFLSEDEINYILSYIPNPYSIDPLIAQAAGDNMRLVLRDYLKVIKLNSVGIETFIQRLVQLYERARIQPGTTVGSIPAEGLGQLIAQMALDAFKSSGSGPNLDNLFARLKQYLEATQKPKNVLMNIYYKERHSFDELYEWQNRYVDVKLTTITWDFSIINSTDLVDPFTGENTIPWWYDFYEVLNGHEKIMYKYVEGRRMIAATSFLRFRLSLDLIYYYQIDLQEFVLDLLAVNQNNIQVVYSPVTHPHSIDEGVDIIYLDIIPIETAIQNIKGINSLINQYTITYATDIFLQQIQKDLNNITIQGIPGVKKINVLQIDVWSSVQDVIPLNQEKTQWLVILNSIGGMITSVDLQSLRNLIRVAGLREISLHEINNEAMRNMDYDKNNMLLLQTDAQMINGKMVTDPGTIIAHLKQTDQQLRDDFHKQVQNKIRNLTSADFADIPKLRADLQLQVPVTDIHRYAYIHYSQAETETPSKPGDYILKHLMTLPEIDTTRTMSTNLHENSHVFGHLAARNFLYLELYNMVTMIGSDIDPRHISLLVDLMFRSGSVHGINYHGIVKQDRDPLSSATYERAADVLSKAASEGVSHQLRSMSSRIVTGSKDVGMGTSYSKISIDSRRVQEIRASLQQPDVEVNAFSIDAARQLLEGNDILADNIVRGPEEKFEVLDANELNESMPRQSESSMEMGTVIRSKAFSSGNAMQTRSAPYVDDSLNLAADIVQQAISELPSEQLVDQSVTQPLGQTITQSVEQVDSEPTESNIQIHSADSSGNVVAQISNQTGGLSHDGISTELLQRAQRNVTSGDIDEHFVTSLNNITGIATADLPSLSSDTGEVSFSDDDDVDITVVPNILL